MNRIHFMKYFFFKSFNILSNRNRSIKLKKNIYFQSRFNDKSVDSLYSVHQHISFNDFEIIHIQLRTPNIEVPEIRTWLWYDSNSIRLFWNNRKKPPDPKTAVGVDEKRQHVVHPTIVGEQCRRYFNFLLSQGRCIRIVIDLLRCVETTNLFVTREINLEKIKRSRDRLNLMNVWSIAWWITIAQRLILHRFVSICSRI